jgi:hypothetical protein
MDALVAAVSEFLAAIFARFGYVGRTQRRAHIREDLLLLEEIRGSEAYGSQSQPAGYLHDHINREVADYSGITLKHERKVPWGTVVLSIPIGLGFAYWTYKIVDDGLSLFSLLTGAVAAFFLIGALEFYSPATTPRSRKMEMIQRLRNRCTSRRRFTTPEEANRRLDLEGLAERDRGGSGVPRTTGVLIFALATRRERPR